MSSLASTVSSPKRHKLTKFAALAFVSALFPVSLWGQEAEVNLSSTIIGNQEQPKVLYIVPWKPVSDEQLENQTIESQLDLVFGHIERVELRRELSYTKEVSTTSSETGE